MPVLHSNGSSPNAGYPAFLLGWSFSGGQGSDKDLTAQIVTYRLETIAGLAVFFMYI